MKISRPISFSWCYEGNLMTWNAFKNTFKIFLFLWIHISAFGKLKSKIKSFSPSFSTFLPRFLNKNSLLRSDLSAKARSRRKKTETTYISLASSSCDCDLESFKFILQKKISGKIKKINICLKGSTSLHVKFNWWQKQLSYSLWLCLSACYMFNIWLFKNTIFKELLVLRQIKDLTQLKSFWIFFFFLASFRSQARKQQT